MKKIQIEDTIYQADTDFRTAIECNRIATDDTINDIERTLGIICTMYGESALDKPEHYGKLLNWCLDYLSNGETIENNNDPDMDFIQDMDYIEASFMSDYGIDLTTTNMEWKKFLNLMNGLSNSELGNCCVLNRVRNLRNFDESQVPDPKERQKIKEAKKRVALNKKEQQLTSEQEESMNRLNEIIFGKE